MAFQNVAFQNVIIDTPLVHPSHLFAFNEQDWEENEKDNTLTTSERFLPRILVEAGLVKSTSEIKRNKPEFWITLEKTDFLEIKWGKKRLFICVGEKE